MVVARDVGEQRPVPARLRVEHERQVGGDEPLFVGRHQVTGPDVGQQGPHLLGGHREVLGYIHTAILSPCRPIRSGDSDEPPETTKE